MRTPPAREEDRRLVEAEVHQAARISAGYFVLLICSCGIAELGLLQSSAAVVIGAMLISPLMAPIIGMGLALARVEPVRFERAAVSLAVGALVSVLASALIVWLSPLKSVTPEILARIRPTLLDLVIAALSGVVGAYVTITRRGAVIAGVAIATALMPPLAVTGFGLATGAMNIAGGSFLLFLTNVVAILGAVFAVARRYGFSPSKRDRPGWETPALIAAIAVLATPLGFSLRSIVVETRETHRVRSAIERIFTKVSPQITNLNVKIAHDRVRQVHVVVVTQKYVAGASDAIRKQLGDSPQVEVEQVLTANGPLSAAATGGALANTALAQGEAQVDSDPAARLTDLLQDIGTVNAVQPGGGVLRAVVRLNQPASLGDYHALEVAAQRFFPGQRLELAPPYSDPPPIAFGEGRSDLDAEADGAVQDMAWALGRWGYSAAVVTGSASPGRYGPSKADHALALARATAVAARLQALGVKSVEVRETVPAPSGAPPATLWTATVRPAGQAAPSPADPGPPAR